MKLETKLMLGAVGAVALVGLAVLIKNKVVASIPDVLNAVNPLNRDNVFYAGVNAIGATVTGNADFSLGASAYEVTHDDQGNSVLNPANPNNPVYSGVSAMGQAASGNKDWTLGGWIYDVTHANDAAGIMN